MGHAVTASTAATSTGDELVGGAADAGWEWAPGSVYADPFLRTFLLSHGFSHAAIAKLTRAWNDNNNAGAGRGPRRIAPEACAALPGWRGCQTKMLLGLPCAAPLAGDGDESHAKASATATGAGGPGAGAKRGAKRAAKVPVPVAPLTFNTSHVAEAVRRIEHDLAFVGLTERFDESVCLFHARFGGHPVPAQFVNVRPMVNRTSSASAGSQTATHAAAAAGGGRAASGRGAMAVAARVDDPWDTAVHAAARARFERDLQAARQAASRDTRQTMSFIMKNLLIAKAHSAIMSLEGLIAQPHSG